MFSDFADTAVAGLASATTPTQYLQENGTNDVQWLKVVVDPHSREAFSYQAQIVPANRVAVPAPQN